MNTQEALLKFNQNRNIVKKAINEINTKEQFLKYGTESTKITLFSNLPKFYDSADNEVELENKVHKLMSLQSLEQLLYEYGVASLREDWTPARVLDYVEINGQIKYLKVKLEFLSAKCTFYVIEEYSYNNNQLNFEYVISKPAKISDNEIKELLFNTYLYTPNINKIPYKIFYNNYAKSPDLNLVNNEYFDLMNKDLQVLMEDSFLSAPWIFASDSSSIKEKIERGIHSLEDRFISINPQVAIYDPEPLRMLQGNSQAQQLIEKIEKNTAWIKKFAFMKQDSNDYGTKNMHNAEIQEINSDFEDYIEAKSNLRELQLLEFVKAFESKEISKVLVYGSTEWLQTQATKYKVDMNGTIINQNAYNEKEITNHNEFNNEQ